jgi:cytochrome P450 family 103
VSTQNLSFQDAASQPLSTATIAELDADPHSRFRHYRGEAPFLQREDGAYLALRAADVEALTSDPRTRQLETELIQSRGITSVRYSRSSSIRCCSPTVGCTASAGHR